MARKGMLPNIVLDDYERETLIDSTKVVINLVKTCTQVNIHDAFCLHVSQHLDNGCDLTIVAKARSQSDGPMWEKTMKSELESFISQKIFSSVDN